MRVTPITAKAFCSSLETALSCPPDPGASIKRMQNMLNALPEGKLQFSSQDSLVFFRYTVNGKRKYLSKQCNLLYSLARKRYQTELLEILRLTGSTRMCDITRRIKLIKDLQRFIQVCERGNLDIARIVLTAKQYKWFTGGFRQKSIDDAKAKKTAAGLPVRSKSERDIIDTYDAYAVPIHYEEQQVVYVKELVDKLYDDLAESGFWGKVSGGSWGKGSGGGQLYDFRGGYIHWNVPAELEWMNAPGSIWKTYYPPRGTITIHCDIKTIFADGSMFLHEHEGMMDSFAYRRNSSERSSILKYTGAVSRENFLETYEHDIDTPEKRQKIIESRVLPRLWF